MKLTNDQIETSINSSSLLMDREFNFIPKKILNKRLIFDISMVHEEPPKKKKKKKIKNFLVKKGYRADCGPNQMCFGQNKLPTRLWTEADVFWPGLA